MSTLAGRITIDVDTGGTFTDGAVAVDGDVLPLKILTTPHDLTVCFRGVIAAAAERLGVAELEMLKRLDSIRYSTTLGTNTIIQRSGPRLGVIVRRDDVATVEAIAPDSLIRSILGPLDTSVRGLSPNGGGPADRDAALLAVEELLEAGAERLVVALSGDPEAERWLKRAIYEEYPRHILGALPVLFSSQLSDDEEFTRRLNTTLLNAYLHPQLEHFLYEAEDILRDNRYDRPLFVFCNDGTSNRVAKVTALKTYNSGPAGGLEGAAALARHYGLARVATVDMGGTSTDLAFLADGQIEEEPFGEIEGTPLSLPMRRISALGGGGGTIAHVVDGEFRLGPQSAGAAPGPACFGFGGTEPTVTDADLVLGYFDPISGFAGEVTLDAGRARSAIESGVAEPLGLSLHDAAGLVRDTIEQRIGGALAEGMATRDADPGEVVLIAYGGGGPVHAAGIAAHAGLRRVLLPELASVLSAFGIGFSDVEHRYSRTVAVDRAVAAKAAEAGRELERRALIDMRGEGFDPNGVELERRTRVLSEDGEVALLAGWAVAALPPAATAVELQLTARGKLPHTRFRSVERPAGAPNPVTTREVWWAGGGGVQTPVYALSDLQERHATITGPAVVAGELATVVVPPGWVLARDEYEQFFLTWEA